jgi:hypothetical protein
MRPIDSILAPALPKDHVSASTSEEEVRHPLRLRILRLLPVPCRRAVAVCHESLGHRGPAGWVRRPHPSGPF